VNYLADREVSPEISPHRQTTLDAHIRARIQSELDSLQAEEKSVRQEIERALEKENLDREREKEDDTSTLGDVKASAALLGDLDEIQRRVEKYKSRRELGGSLAARASGEALLSCYKCVIFYSFSVASLT
jgi:MICOS complex subunit MIC19